MTNGNSSALRLFVLIGQKIGDPHETAAQTFPVIKHTTETRELRYANNAAAT
ncbi:hypothetical protein [Falsiruegeria litorea]|uniref:hypothetical protein n=1 Tax=Falsiruegeria litorea TaxID=1280831 RepID=UPI0013FD453C|nr:hypothetical protein [Falsiruegeria litorea]